MVPSGSLLPAPFSITVSPSFTVWSGPASAIGGSFAHAGQRRIGLANKAEQRIPIDSADIFGWVFLTAFMKNNSSVKNAV